MAQYRKKPIIVEANQWLGPQSSPMKGVYVDGDTNDPRNYYVITAHNQKTPIKPKDWIILEIVQGHTDDMARAYPCKPDIFEATYEPNGGN